MSHCLFNQWLPIKTKTAAHQVPGQETAEFLLKPVVVMSSWMELLHRRWIMEQLLGQCDSSQCCFTELRAHFLTHSLKPTSKNMNEIPQMEKKKKKKRLETQWFSIVGSFPEGCDAPHGLMLKDLNTNGVLEITPEHYVILKQSSCAASYIKKDLPPFLLLRPQQQQASDLWCSFKKTLMLTSGLRFSFSFESCVRKKKKTSCDLWTLISPPLNPWETNQLLPQPGLVSQQ